jgi:ribosome-associated protein
MKIIKAKIAQKKEKQIKINTDFIRLDSALKLANIAQSGGHAKTLIQDGEVKVNGEICVMRGKKLHNGDKFETGLYVVEVTGA